MNKAGFTMDTYGLAQRAAPWLAFEGADGCGKDTVVQNISEALDINIGDGNYTVIKYPGGTAAGQILRSVLTTGDAEQFHPDQEAVLFAMDRVNTYDNIVVPTIKANGWVLSNRWYPSAEAYQGAGRGLGADRIRELDEQIYGDRPQPDFTFLYDVDPEISYARVLERVKRSGGQLGRFESLGLDFQKRIVDSYREQADEHMTRFFIIDASKPPNEVFDETMHWINWLLLEGKIPTNDALPDVSNSSHLPARRIEDRIAINAFPGNDHSQHLRFMRDRAVA
ncbi:MAG: dTMP kinase [Alphaproteobacteria bacterium]|nr:dTMP kinase [Alphaproteobacteria bacterium]